MSIQQTTLQIIAAVCGFELNYWQENFKIEQFQLMQKWIPRREKSKL